MEMFCFQCQETCRNSGCTVQGACGKKAATAKLQDELISEMKRMAIAHSPNAKRGLFVAETMFMTITNANFDDDALQKQLLAARALNADSAITVEPGVLSCADVNIRSLRELITYGLKGIAAYTVHAAMLGFEDQSIYAFLFKALKACAEEHSAPELTELVMECGRTAVDAMALLDKANGESFGHKEITRVKTSVGQRPGILVSGHDLRDMLELLEQSRNAGIDIYTHSEMLPAHYYPKLKKFKHLYGNYGTSWYQQNVEFASFNGPILMTTNCITPVQVSYRDRIFTTGMAGYPGVKHIPERHDNKPKDFSEIIEMARHCPPPQQLDDTELVGGFGHEQLTALAPQIIEAVKSGAIRRLIVMAGCDGRHPSREYFTEVAEKLPPDSVILTAGCAKYRYNKLNLGSIGGIPRVIDAGQCNDSYSLAVIAIKLQGAFKLDDVNKLPLSFDIAWYEQKAVAVLLALLALGFKNIRLGPTLPAFLSPDVAGLLVKEFGIKLIGTPEADIAEMFG